MENNREVMRILKEEYGIETAEDLDEAIRNLAPIDLSPFCGDVPRREGEKEGA